MDVETITTNNATLSLTQDTYFAPGITQPVGFKPNLYGICQTAPNPVTDQTHGGLAYIDTDSSLNIYANMNFNNKNTPNTYITNLDGTQTSFRLSNINNTYGTAYIVSYTATGQFRWACAPVQSPTTTAIEFDGLVVMPSGNIMAFFYIQANAGVNIYNGTTLVASNQYTTYLDFTMYTVHDPTTGALLSYNTVYTTGGTSSQYWYKSAQMLWGSNALVGITTICSSQGNSSSPNQLYLPAGGGYNTAIIAVNETGGTKVMANPIALTSTSQNLYLGGYAVDSSNNLYIGMWVALSTSPVTLTINNLSTNASSGNSITLNGNDNVVLMYDAAGNFVRTLVQVNVGGTDFPQLESDGTNLWVCFQSTNSSLTVNGVTATNNYTYSGYILNITPTGTVLKFVSAFNAYGLQTTFYGAANRRMWYDSKNSLMYLDIYSTGTAVTGSAMHNMDGTTSLVTNPTLGTTRTENPLFILNTSTGKWQYTMIPFSVNTGHLTISDYSMRAKNGYLYFSGFLTTDQSSVLISDGNGNYSVGLTTDPDAWTTNTTQPYLVTWGYNNQAMQATLPLPNPSTGNYLQKTLILQPNLVYEITEQNNSGNNVRTIPTPTTGLNVVQYYYVNDAWTPDFSTVDLVNNIVYNTTTTQTVTSVGDASTLQGLNASQFMRSDAATGVTASSTARVFTANNTNGGAQIASFQNNGTEILGVNAGGCTITGGLTVSGSLSGTLPWTDISNLPSYIVYCQGLTSDVQAQINALSTSLSNGGFLNVNSNATLSGSLIFNGSVNFDSTVTCNSSTTTQALTVNGNFTTATPITYTANNPAMLVKTYAAGDSYGIDQTVGGQLNIDCSSTYGPAQVNLGVKDSAGNFTSKLSVFNTSSVGLAAACEGTFRCTQLNVKYLNILQGLLKNKYYRLDVPVNGNYVSFPVNDLSNLSAGIWKIYAYGSGQDAVGNIYMCEGIVKISPDNNTVYVRNQLNDYLYISLLTYLQYSSSPSLSFPNSGPSVIAKWVYQIFTSGNISWPQDVKLISPDGSGNPPYISIVNSNSGYQIDTIHIGCVLMSTDFIN